MDPLVDVEAADHPGLGAELAGGGVEAGGQVVGVDEDAGLEGAGVGGAVALVHEPGVGADEHVPLGQRRL
ncbi:hypothetical protein RZS08_31000, partial [Arthrospira platensis SPKY1]|nr:hypothetical protein [Arthrospira platensis SPKY1]